MHAKRQVELIAVMGVYFLIYVVILGPAIGSITGFDASVLTDKSGRGSQLVQILTTPQGWILISGFFPILFGYMVIRARIAGVAVPEYWTE